MPTSLPCPHCAAKLQIPDGFKATKAKCPKCGQTVTLSGGTSAEAATPLTKATAAKTPAMQDPVMQKPATPQPAVGARSPVAASPGANSPAPLKPIPIVLLAIAGGGALVAAVGVVALGIFFFSPSSSDDTHSHNDSTTSMTTSDQATPVHAAVSVPVVQSTPTSSPPATAWHTYHDEPFRFSASFPVEPSPYDPTAEITDPKERELAAAMMKGRQNLKAVHGDRTYILSAAPIQLGGTPAKVYLDRMSGAAAAVHRGFQVEERQEIDLSGSPGMDFSLASEGKRKLLRVVVANEHVYSLLMAGDHRLAFADADAQQFFSGFVPAGTAGGVAPESTAANGTVGSSHSSSDSPVVTASQNEVTGETIGFRVAFPSPGAAKVDLLDLITDSKQRKNAANLFPASEFQQETWSLTDGDRTYTIAAFCNLNERDQGAARESSQRGRFELLTEYLYGRVGREERVKYAPTERHGMEGTDMLVMRETGEKAIVREAQAGKYSFFVLVEGGSDLTRGDPAVQAFFQSLHPPPDSPPLPAKGPIYTGAIVRSYHPIRGIELEANGKLITVKTTPSTAVLDPDGVQYRAGIPNLAREIVCRVGNVVDIVMYPPSPKLNPPTVRVLQVRKINSDN